MLSWTAPSITFFHTTWGFVGGAVSFLLLAIAGFITLSSFVGRWRREKKDSAIETHSGKFTVSPGSASCEIAVCHAMLSDVTNVLVEWDRDECEVVPCDAHHHHSHDRLSCDLVQIGRELILIIKWSTSRVRSGRWYVTRKTFVTGHGHHDHSHRHHHKK